jgi:Bacterial SH3 domain
MKATCMVLGMLIALSGPGWAATNFDVRVITDNVNLRVRPDAGTEVVAQAHEGQILTVVQVEGIWRGVLAPTNAQVWVKSQFVKKGLVAGDKLKLRSGPGISFRDMGLIRGGTSVIELETHGEWVRIAPPGNLILWASESLVAPIAATTPKSQAEPCIKVLGSAPVAPVEIPAASPLPHDLPPGLAQESLASVLGQGAMVARTGTVERVPLAFLRGVDYRLVETRDGAKVMVCFLEGNDSQMPSLVGHRLIVKGREYWLKSQRFAVLYPELITPVVD